MPLSKVGQEVMANMKARYGDKKGESVFYASRNAGKPGSDKWEKLKGIRSYRFGGVVKQTGLALLHKGETVTPARRYGAEHFGRITEDEPAIEPPSVDIGMPTVDKANRLTKLKLIRSRLK